MIKNGTRKPKLEISGEKVTRLLEAKGLHYVLSLQAPVGDEDLYLGDTIKYESAVSPEKALIRRTLMERTREAFSTPFCRADRLVR